MFTRIIKEQIVTEVEKTVVTVANRIAFEGVNDSLLRGEGSCTISAVGRKEDGGFVFLPDTTNVRIEDAVGKKFKYIFNGETKNMSVTELIAIMGSFCEEAWAGAFNSETK